MAHEHEFQHDHSHAPAHDHVHESGPEQENAHPHSYAHFHSPEEKKRQLNRLSRVIGHLQHVKKMIEADEDCADVLNQLSATRSAITGLGKEIMNEHIRHCISHAIEDGDMEAVEEFQKAIEKFF
ncbi:MAG: metal-sensing transcriptional repressor [Oscillospiraceae bacterium]|nr:metal-sensing transcriptional repressor [Oscillospiraceae bacterium]